MVSSSIFLSLLHLVIQTTVPMWSHALPSARIVYYLHTNSATCNEATTMCYSYGATLVTFTGFNATVTNIPYVDSHFWDSALTGLQDGFWAGLYRNSTDHLRWQGCAEYDSKSPPPVHTPTSPLQPTSCYASDANFRLFSLQCNAKRPYICQRDDGQCWFQPYVDTMIVDNDLSTSHINDTTATDEGDCAKLCRNAVETGRECWGFTYRQGQCTLHFSDNHHMYAAHVTPRYFRSATQFTAYVKICTGGWKTSLTNNVVDESLIAQDENCTVTPDDEWDTSMCYCECDQPPIILEAETLVMTIDEKVEKIVKELQVNPHNTSNTRRKKISVEDSRPSAQGIGYFGLAFLLLVFGGIFLLDANVLLAHAADICKTVKAQNQSEAA